jgi:hypothetical protein
MSAQSQPEQSNFADAMQARLFGTLRTALRVYHRAEQAALAADATDEDAARWVAALHELTILRGEAARWLGLQAAMQKVSDAERNSS